MTIRPFIRLFVLIGIVVTLSAFKFPGFKKAPEETAYIPSGQPKQIALLLPLSGKYADAARAIREGFLASHYGSSLANKQKPSVRVYDTAKDSDIQKIYLASVEEGADFIVGPLTKEEVLRLSQLSSRAMAVPVLALNYHPDVTNPSKRLTQFSLLPENEASQLAEKALHKGYRRACIIVSDNPWGHRIANAFSDQWESSGGTIVNTVFANPSNDQATEVRRLLNIPEKAAKDIKSYIEAQTEINADTNEAQTNLSQGPNIDVIIMAANPEQARQLKPLFDFYSADNIPVLATSSVYSGQPDPKVDHDLNGVIFCDMPWLVDNTRRREIEQLLRLHGDKGSEFNRLFAMGVDAYHLTSQLGQLQLGNTYAGATGNLYMINQQIHQNLAWAKIVNGVPKVLTE